MQWYMSANPSFETCYHVFCSTIVADMHPSDYWAETFCLACAIFSLARLFKNGMYVQTPMFMMFLVSLIPAITSWLLSWDAGWPFLLLVVSGFLSAAAIEATWLMTYNLYALERHHVRQACLMVGSVMAGIVLLAHPSYPKFPEWSFLPSLILTVFSLGTLAMGFVYWVRFPSAGVGKFAWHGLWMAVYGGVITNASITREDSAWHTTLGVTVIIRGALLALSTLSLTHSKAVRSAA